jgi:hypothetical protein
VLVNARRAATIAICTDIVINTNDLRWLPGTCPDWIRNGSMNAP